MNRRNFISAAALSLGTCGLAKGQCFDCEPHYLLPAKDGGQYAITKAVASGKKQISLNDHASGNPTGYRYIGSNGGFDIFLENMLVNQKGMQLARNVLGGVAATNLLRGTSGFFGGIGLGNTPQVYITRLSMESNGTGGAFHFSCAGTQLYIDCTYNAAPNVPNYDPVSRALALVEAELAECFMASAMNFPQRPQSYNCGWSNGEALSRMYAEMFFPNILDDFSSVDYWLSNPVIGAGPLRPNWVDFTEETDQDYNSIGCDVAFMCWLIRRKGFNLGQITWCAQNTLAETYALLTQRPKTEAFSLFMQDVTAFYPVASNGVANYGNILDGQIFNG